MVLVNWLPECHARGKPKWVSVESSWLPPTIISPQLFLPGSFRKRGSATYAPGLSPSPMQTTHKVLGWWVGMEELAPERCPCTPLLPLGRDDQLLRQWPKSDAWSQPSLLKELTFPNHPHARNSFSRFCSIKCFIFLSPSPLKARSFFWEDHISSSADLITQSCLTLHPMDYNGL